MKKIMFLLSITFISPIISMDTKFFFDAVERGDVKTIKDLVANRQIKDLNVRNENGDTALMIAVNRNYIDIVKELLSLYARADLVNKNGQDVLEMAINAENPPMVTTILNYTILRSDIDRKNKDGDTALILAVKKGNIEIIKAILNEVPDPSVENKKKETAMTFVQAMSEKSESEKTVKNEIIKLLNDAQNQYNLYQEVRKLKPDISIIKAILTPSFKVLNTPNQDKNSLIIAIHFSSLLEYDKDIIPLLIQHGADVNQLLRNGETPLITAIDGRQVATVKQLLDAGADPLMKIKGKTALNIVQEKLARAVPADRRVAYEQISVALQQVLPTKNEEELFQAIEKGDATKVQELLAAGVDIYEKRNYQGELINAIEFAVKKNKQEIVNIFKPVIVTKFNKALEDENISEIKNLIPYISAELALIQAIKKNKAAAVTMILNTFRVNINRQDKDSNTPLILAIKTNNKDIIQAVLNANPDQSLKNKNGETAMTLAQAISNETLKKQIIDLLNQYDLYQAIINRNFSAVKTLVESGAFDVNQPIKGATPLLFAIQKGSPEIVEILLQNNAKPNLAASDGTTPLSLAQAKFFKAKDPAKPNYLKIINLLNKAIAKLAPTEPIISTISDQLLSALKNFIQTLRALQVRLIVMK